VASVTADTNIYISALNFGGPPDKVLDLARAGEIKLSISDDIMNEILRVLREKFRWTDEAVKLAKERIGDFTVRVEPTQKVDAIKEDPTDDRILECAMASGSEYLVTGDRHLLKLGQYAGTKIVGPADFLEIQAQTGRGR